MSSLDELIERAKSGMLMEREEGEVPEKGPGLRSFNVFVEGQYYNVGVEEAGGKPRIKSVSDTAPIIKRETKRKEKKQKRAAKAKQEKAKSAAPEPSREGEHSVIAPMPGMVVQFEVKEGDTVDVGDVLVILEAMKMQNSLTANVAGIVRSLKVPPGTSVEKNQVLLTIAR